MSKWKSVPLSALVAHDRAISYGIVQPGSHQDGGVPILRVADIRGGRINACEPMRVSAEIEVAHARTRLRGGELLLTLVGTVGEAAVVPQNLAGWNVARAVAVIPIREDVGAYWVKLALETPSVREMIHGRLNTTVQATLNLKDVAQLPILLPSVDERLNIANILGTLDDKIELNRRTNETLEAVARAIFKSWFVDFDPIRAKAGELVSEKVLEIGDGYRAKNDELGDEGLPFIRAMNLKNGFDTTGADRLKPDCMVGALSKCSRVGDVAFTSKGTVGRFARVGKATEAFVYSPQVCFWRTLDSVRLHPAVLYCWMQSDDFLTQLHGRSGQTDMAPYVSLRDQRGMFIPRFDASQAEVGRKIAPLLDLVSENQAQSRTLSILRDTLLPRLLSGEIEIDTASREMDVVATC